VIQRKGESPAMASETAAVATVRLAARSASPGDEELVDRAVGGDRQAFEELVIRYQDRVYNLLFRLTGSSADAEDLAQETFLKAYRALASFRRGSKFYTWLFRIAVNAGYSLGRKQANRQRIEGLSLDATANADQGDDPTTWRDRMAGPTADPSEELEQRQLRERIQEGVTKLDEDFRAVILLREMEGLDYASISEALDISYAAVRSRLYRARSELARVLKDLKPERRAAGA
jgi:RNA polymerase sigma-70 factor (ECF subfamily)